MLVRTRALRAFFTACCQISLAVETATPVASFIFSKVIGIGRLRNAIITARRRGDISFPITNYLCQQPEPGRLSFSLSYLGYCVQVPYCLMVVYLGITRVENECEKTIRNLTWTFHLGAKHTDHFRILLNLPSSESSHVSRLGPTEKTLLVVSLAHTLFLYKSPLMYPSLKTNNHPKENKPINNFSFPSFKVHSFLLLSLAYRSG